MSPISADLAHFKYLTQWIPAVGDVVICHGWFTHWYGVVRSLDPVNNTVNIIRKGLPVLLLTLDQGEHDDNAITIPTHKIRQSSGGKYATIKSVGNNTVWYI